MLRHSYARTAYASAADTYYARNAGLIPYALFRNPANSGKLVRVYNIFVQNPTFAIGLRDGQTLGDPGGGFVQQSETGIPNGINTDRSSYSPSDAPLRYSRAELYCSQVVAGPAMGQLAYFAQGPATYPPSGEIVLPPERSILVRSGVYGSEMSVNFNWTEEDYQ